MSQYHQDLVSDGEFKPKGDGAFAFAAAQVGNAVRNALRFFDLRRCGEPINSLLFSTIGLGRGWFS